MTEEQVDNNAQGGGQQPGTFTQHDLDRIVAERLARERAKFGDYETLKERATKWDEHETAQKTEMEKLTEARQAAEQRAEAALATANERLVRAAFVAAAAQVGAAHPEDAFALADRAAVQVDEAGNVQGVAEAVAALVANGRLVMRGNPPAPSLDGGAGSGQRGNAGGPEPTPEQLKVARGMGISIADYMKQIMLTT